MSCDEDGNPICGGGGNSLLTDDDAAARSLFNASCPYTPSPTEESHLHVFAGDRDIQAEEQFGPGTELVYRCADIGRFGTAGGRKKYREKNCNSE